MGASERSERGGNYPRERYLRNRRREKKDPGKKAVGLKGFEPKKLEASKKGLSQGLYLFFNLRIKSLNNNAVHLILKKSPANPFFAIKFKTSTPEWYNYLKIDLPLNLPP